MGYGTRIFIRKRSSWASGSGRCLPFRWGFGRHDEEGLVENVGMVAAGDGVFLHCFEQGGLCFRGRAVDFVGQDEVSKDGAGDELEGLGAGLSGVSIMALPTMSPGMRSGVNCMREYLRCRTRERVRRSVVLPRPGTPSKRTCPPASRHIRTPSTTSFWPTMILPISWRTRLSCEVASWRAVSGCTSSV